MVYWPHLYLLVFVLIIWGLEKLFPRFMERAEENLLILILTAIMVVSFGQVIARYGFNTGWSAALEFNTLAFSWLIILGMAYGIKIGLHLGVDIVLNAVPTKVAKILSLVGALAALFYGLILIDSIWMSWLGLRNKRQGWSNRLLAEDVQGQHRRGGVALPGISPERIWNASPRPSLADDAGITDGSGNAGLPLPAGLLEYSDE